MVKYHFFEIKENFSYQNMLTSYYVGYPILTVSSRYEDKVIEVKNKHILLKNPEPIIYDVSFCSVSI